MSVYTVHAPTVVTLRNEADSFVFVRDGFHFWALVFGPFWLLWHRLWLVLLGYVATTAVIGVALAVLGAPSNVRLLVFLLVAVLMGLEAASLRRWSYSRGKWRQIDFVVADDEEKAERRFFDRWTEYGTSRTPPASDIPPPPSPFATRPPPSAPHGVLGLFPEPGGRR
jgi:hypothetical protein